MSPKTQPSSPQKDSIRPAPRLRLPGFIAGEEIGLGDAIKRATSYIGIQPCAGCERRANVLNHWMAITGRRSR
jgi:hypothetical protein